jgi:hypothetical protein
MAHINPQGIMLYGTISVGSRHGQWLRNSRRRWSSASPNRGATENRNESTVRRRDDCGDLTYGLTWCTRFPAHSGPRVKEHTEDLRFFLTQAEVEDIETLRPVTNADVFTLHLDLDVVVAGLKSHNKTGTAKTPWDSRLGMFSEILPFWTVQVQPLQMDIEQSVWVREVAGSRLRPVASRRTQVSSTSPSSSQWV